MSAWIWGGAVALIVLWVLWSRVAPSLEKTARQAASSGELAPLLAALANGFDAGHALLSQTWFQLPGALVFAIAYLAAALWLFNRDALVDRR